MDVYGVLEQEMFDDMENSVSRTVNLIVEVWETEPSAMARATELMADYPDSSYIVEKYSVQSDGTID